MILQITDWATFKNICIKRKNLNLQYVDLGPLYRILGPDANDITWEYALLKTLDDGSVNPAVEDFEENIAPTCNWAIGARAYPFSTPDFQFYGDAIKTTATKNATTNIDYTIPGTPGVNFYYINGAVLITSSAVFGDYASASVVDVNNIMGYGANTVLATYVPKWYIDPEKSMDVVTPYAGKLTAGLVLRIAYTSVSVLTDVGVAVNYRLHRPL